jgi:hypothetical protein
MFLYFTAHPVRLQVECQMVGSVITKAAEEAAVT